MGARRGEDRVRRGMPDPWRWFALDELVADHAHRSRRHGVRVRRGGGNIEEAPLFGAGVGALGESDRDVTVFDADQVHDRPFESLGRMEGAELDAIGDGGDMIVGAQRREEVVDGGAAFEFECPRAMSRNAWSIARRSSLRWASSSESGSSVVASAKTSDSD